MLKIFVLIFCTLMMCSCKEQQERSFVEKVEHGHKKNDFLSHEAISFKIALTFGGKERLTGKMTLLTGSGKGLIELEDGRKIYQIEDKVFYSPEFEETKGIRFDAYTWSYFFLFPYKLSDQGTVWSPYNPEELNGKKYITQKLTFESGIGDAPEDWYVVYVNPENQLIEVAAYIVTAHKSKEEAEKDPHAIVYEDYELVEGIPIATAWTFWAWDKEKGLTKELGSANLSDIDFVQVSKGMFHPPLDFKKI